MLSSTNGRVSPCLGGGTSPRIHDAGELNVSVCLALFAGGRFPRGLLGGIFGSGLPGHAVILYISGIGVISLFVEFLV